MYGLLITAAMLFSLQFLFQQKFGEGHGEGLPSLLVFTTWTSLFGFFAMVIGSGFSLQISWFSVAMACFYMAVTVGFSFFSLKALRVGDLSVYSLYAMLGGMLLPTIYGIIVREPVSWMWALGFAGIVLALILTVDTKLSKRNLLIYMAVFVTNGMVGVISKIHQSSSMAVNSPSFLAISFAMATVVSCVWYWRKMGKFPSVQLLQLFHAGGYAVCNGIGNLFCLIALNVLSASVQYPFITGGTIFFSAMIGWFQKEKFTGKKIFTIILVLVSTICLAL